MKWVALEGGARGEGENEIAKSLSNPEKNDQYKCA